MRHSADDRLKSPAPGGFPDLEIIVVAYESWAVLEGCLQSIRRSTPAGMDVRTWVVDNGSDEETPRNIRARHPEVTYHRQGSNSGFSCANNHALERVTAPYVLFLNPDAELQPMVLEHLLAGMESDPQVGLTGCRLLQTDGSFDRASKRSFPTARSAVSYFLRGRRGGQYTAPEVHEEQRGEVDAVNGAFMLIRTAAIRAVGNMDERFWMYGEDLDLCRRLKDAGWRIVYDGTVTATHHKSAISGRARSPKLNWHFHKSMVLYYAKHDAGQHRWVDAAVYAGIAARLVAVTMRDQAVRMSSRRAARRARPEVAVGAVD